MDLNFKGKEKCALNLISFVLFCSYMTLSDTETAAEVLSEKEKKWSIADVRETHSSHSETTSPSNRMQYSPELTNGYDEPEIFTNQALEQQSSSPEAQESLPVDELKSLIRHQLEFYFSRYVFNPFCFCTHIFAGYFSPGPHQVLEFGIKIDHN